MVTTHAFRPRRAPSSAMTAAVVVLPTPPVPQQITTWRSVTSSSIFTTGPSQEFDPARQRVAEGVERRAGDVGREEEGQLDLGQRQPLAQAIDLFLLQRVPFATELG